MNNNSVEIPNFMQNIYKEREQEKLKSETLMWRDNNDVLYSLSSNLKSDELIKIMNNISCQ